MLQSASAPGDDDDDGDDLHDALHDDDGDCYDDNDDLHDDDDGNDLNQNGASSGNYCCSLE